MYRNLVTDLVQYERITTTEAKAKEIRPMTEKMVTLARRGDLHARRQALRFIYSEKAVKHLFDEIGPRMKDRPGGYLRITKLEPRKGDGAKMATIEFVDYGGLVTAMPRPQRVTAAPTAASSTLAPAPAAPAPATEEPAEMEAMDTAEEAVADVEAVEVEQVAAEVEATAEAVAETGAAAVADIEPEAEAPADEVEAPAATVADESDEEAPEKA
jgi:large subunit ribosomal protein L17